MRAFIIFQEKVKQKFEKFWKVSKTVKKSPEKVINKSEKIWKSPPEKSTKKSKN